MAFLACHLGASASLIAHVGDDDLQEQALRPLREKGIDLEGVKSVKNQPTGVSMIAVSPDGKKQIILAPNANDVWEESDADGVQEALEQAPEGSVLVVDYEVAAFIVVRAIKAAKKRNFPVILDPSPYDRVDRKLLSQVDYLVPDDSETEGLTGILPDSVENAKKAALKLREEGVANVLVKMKDGGCVAATKEFILHIPPVPAEAVDTTGAGDAFAGALSVAVLENRPLKEAACFASSASLAAITGYGSQPAYPNREQIGHYFDQVFGKIQEL